MYLYEDGVLVEGIVIEMQTSVVIMSHLWSVLIWRRENVYLYEEDVLVEGVVIEYVRVHG